MKQPVEIIFRNAPHSNEVEAKIREKTAKLETFCDNIIGCRVAVEAQYNKGVGKIYHIKIDLSVPGEELVVKREPRRNAQREDIYAAIRDAFFALRRQLQDYTQRRRGEVKNHQPNEVEEEAAEMEGIAAG